MGNETQETRQQQIERIFVWHPQVEVKPYEYLTIDDFHEFACNFILTKFKERRSNADAIQFWLLRRPGCIHILETRYQDETEKHQTQLAIRAIVSLDKALLMIASVSEVWISPTITPENRQAMKGLQPRHMPGREDGLMVTTEHRDGLRKMTKWVVKLKNNPANNRVLARDDVDLTGTEWAGYQVGMFGPLVLPKDEDTDEISAALKERKQ